MNDKQAIAQKLGIEIDRIKSVEVWVNVLFVRFNSGSPRFVSKKVIKDVKKMAKFQVKTGSEWHTTEKRSAMVKVNGKAIYEVLEPISKPEWEMIGNKGKHGKWCIAEYEIPTGSQVSFAANANGKKTIEFSFVVGSQDVDVDGYSYGSNICGWIVSI